MPTNEVVSMIMESLRAMAIGVPCVFLVLAVFYAVIKLLMPREKCESSARTQKIRKKHRRI